MAFSKEALRSALDTVNSRRKAAQKAFDQQKAAVYAANPELNSIEAAIKIKSSRLALCALSADTKQVAGLRKELTELNAQRDRIISEAKLPKEPKYTCPLCRDSGYADGVLCSCVKDLAAKMCFSSLISEMPLEASTFDSFDINYYSNEKDENGICPRRQMTAVLKTCKSFAEDFPKGQNLLLTGNSGLGKTHLSLAIANVVLANGFNVIYGSAQNLINEVSRETFDRSGSTDKIDSLNSCDLLILDDLGTEFSTQLSVSVVYNIINTRLLRGLSTVISTNLGIKQISDIYNDRITSRLVGSYSICPCFGSDIRQLKVMKSKIKKP